MRKKAGLKLKSQNGETFIEILASVIIISFGVILFVSLVLTSHKINISQKAADSAFYTALGQCETLAGGESSSDYAYITDSAGAQLEKAKCTVISSDGLAAYSKEAGS